MRLLINPKRPRLADNPARNIGIDLLRIVSSFYVILLHTLGLGGILKNLEPQMTQYKVYWFIEIWSYCAVNIFIIISGFTGYTDEKKETDWSKLIIIWLQVVFYSVIIAVIYKFINTDMVSGETIRNMFFPLSNDIYWFFSAYTGLYILKPFLNAAIRTINKKTLQDLMFIVFLSFCCFSMVTNPFRLSEGYSFSWFVILYLIGAYLKKGKIDEKFSALKSFGVLIILTTCTLLWKIYGFDIKIMSINFHRDSLISYISPVTVTAAVFHVILFSKMKLPLPINKLISFFAPGAFAVYLINTHPCLWLTEFENRFADWGSLKTFSGLFRLSAYAVLFVTASLLIDKFRQFLFQKLKLHETIHQILYGPERIKALKKIIGPLYAVSFFGIWVFLFWKCHIGYGNIDEALYLTVPYRLLKWGDGLLVHEWHEFQLSTFPMLPVTIIYNRFFLGTERIILNFRLIYTFFWGLSALFFYNRMNRYSKTGAAIASLTYLIYAPYGIMALSYNSMGILFLLNAGIIGMTATHHQKIQYIISGIFLAGSILCCPFLLVLYFLLTISVLIFRIKRINRTAQVYWLYATIGAFLIFFIFCAFLLSRASLQELIRSIPIVLDDVEHLDRSLITKTLQYFTSILYASPYTPFILISFLATCIASKIKKNNADLGLSCLCIETIIQVLFYANNNKHINCLMLPICMFGLFCALNSEDPKIHFIFRCLWIPGMIYTYCLNYSSNQGIYAITNASVIPAFASIIILVIYLQNPRAASRKVRILLLSSVSMMLITQIGCEIYLRYNNVFWEDGVSGQVIPAQTGPEKDIMMTEAHYKEYNRLITELEPIRNNDEINRVLFFTQDPVLYLCTEKAIGAFSSWLPGISEHSLKRLDLYYELNPDKIPEIIYIPNKYSEYIPHFETMGYLTDTTKDENFVLTQEK